jgi:hypothetical protein
MDENGENVFFTTRERLAPGDTDELIDVYDARVGGGFAGEGEAKVSECQGEACQATTGFPSLTVPATLSFQSFGNIQPEIKPESKPTVRAQQKAQRCPRGKIKQKGGKCVKAKARKPGKRAKKSTARTGNRKRGGAK